MSMHVVTLLRTKRHSLGAQAAQSITLQHVRSTAGYLDLDLIEAKILCEILFGYNVLS